MINNYNTPRFFTGVVEDINDPLMLGRIRVRILGIHSHIKAPSSLTGIQTSDLLWSYVIQPITSAAISGVGTSPTGIVQGANVFGFHLDEYYQNNIIIGTTAGIFDSMPNFNYGFNDPDQVYPKAIGSDINLLARGEVGPVVQAKRDNQLKNVEQCKGEWSEPVASYEAKYPFNTVTETRSGHTFEVDDTPTKERLTRTHRTGTFEDIQEDGTRIQKIVKDNYEIILGNDFVHVSGNVNVFVVGNADIVVEGNVDARISGNINATVKRDANITVNGNCTENVDGNLTQTIKGNYTLNVGGSKTDAVSGSWSRSASTVNDTASGGFKIDGSRIDLG